MPKNDTAKTPIHATITGLSHDGRGITHISGKTVFVAGALPDEEVNFVYLARRGKFDEGETQAIIKSSPHRTTPVCPHFSHCGGCSLQHIQPSQQILFKQQTLLEQLRHMGGLAEGLDGLTLLPPLTANTAGYRRKARLGVRYVRKKERVLVGFREKNGRYLAEIESCAVLDERIGQKITALRELVGTLNAFDHIPQIEVAIGDDAIALVFRHMTALDPDDLTRLTAWGHTHNIHLYLQPGGLDSVHRLWPDSGPERLCYRLPEYDLELLFHPTDFIQVHAEINRLMVQRALSLLDPKPTDHILDLFCGLGNFTLPLARHSAHVTGIEGDERMVERARENARHNRLENVAFHQADLMSEVSLAQAPWLKQRFDKILLDPSRHGALELIRHLPAQGANRIVYISCNPATLARDTKELIQRGYCLKQAGVMDMFPHTGHVESMAVFDSAN